MTRTPEESLREARSHFALMRRHAQSDLDDQLVIDAICMRLSAGVGATAAPALLRSASAGGDKAPWPPISRMGASIITLGGIRAGRAL